MKSPFPDSFWFRSMVFIAMALLHVGSVVAQQPFDVQAMMEKLQAVKDVQEQARQSVLGSAYRQVQDASSSPSSAWSFYEEAIKATRFAGKSGAAGEFMNWRRNAADKIKTPAFQEALRFHLRYLGLTLRKTNGEDSDELLRDINAYVTDLAANDAELTSSLGPRSEGAALLNKNITGSIFVSFLKLDGQIRNMSDWEMAPGNIAGILDKTLRPALREAKNQSLPRTWDWQIELEKNRLSSSRVTLTQEKFQQQRIPSLRWARAKEFIVLGSPKTAAEEMLNIIQSNPQHPDARKWVAELEELLKSQAPPAAPETAPAPAAVPETEATQEAEEGQVDAAAELPAVEDSVQN